jgi:hypothetical protein
LDVGWNTSMVGIGMAGSQDDKEVVNQY